MSGKRKQDGGGGGGRPSKKKFLNKAVSAQGRPGGRSLQALLRALLRSCCAFACRLERNAGSSVPSELILLPPPPLCRRRCRSAAAATPSAPPFSLAPPPPPQPPSGSRAIATGGRGILISCMSGKEMQAGKEASALFTEVRLPVPRRASVRPALFFSCHGGMQHA